MNGTGFIIDMKVLHELGFSINKQMKQISGIMESYRTAVNVLINMSNFQGETAEAVRAYFEEVHLEIISTLETCSDSLRASSDKYLHGYRKIEPDEKALIYEEAMHEADTDIKYNGSMLLSFIDTINGIIKQVDDIYYAGKLSPTKAEDLYNKTIKYINKKGEAIAENESKVYHNHIKPTQELIFSSYDIIKRFRTDIKGMEKYKSGAVSKIDGLEELRKCRGKCEKTYNDCFDELVEADADIVEARIEYEKGQESLWSRFWDYEIESIDAIGGVAYDEAEYFAEADELPDFLRDFCRGVSGEHTKTTISGLLGAGVAGLAKSGAELGKLGSKVLGHPQDTTEEFAKGTIDTLQNTDKIPDAAKQWWDTTSTYEKFTTVVEFYATCKVFQELFPGAEGETVRLESEAVSDVSKGTKATSKIAEVEDGINAVEKAGVEVGKISESGYGSLSNVEARKWYLEHEAKIPDMLDTNLSLEGQAKQAFDLRNKFRTEARELMSDRTLAESLYKTDPNWSWEMMVQKQIDKGLTGDDIYKEIIASAQRSRKAVNKSLGLE